MSVTNPFLFLRPYQLNKKFKLEGRDEEETALLSLLRWKDIVVVFGKSGIGKTSFINHTLSAKIHRVSWLPIRITRQLNINDALDLKLQNVLQARSVSEIHDETFKNQAEQIPPAEPPADFSNHIVSNMRELHTKWNRPVYLIIDQLEEVFLIGSPTERSTFLKTLELLMNARDIQKKIILVLREEHLGFIQDVERILPGVFQEALPIKEIKAKAADSIYDSLVSPANEASSPELAEFAEKIAPWKTGILGKCIENDAFDAQKLQILLYLLWEDIFNNTSTEPPEPFPQKIDKILLPINPLKEYIDNTVNTALARNAKLLKATYWWLLRNAISPAKTKMPVSVKELFNCLCSDIASDNVQFQVSLADLTAKCDDLIAKRLLDRMTDSPPGEPDQLFFQLTHDTLVPPIQSLDPGLPLQFPKKVSLDQQLRNPYQGLGQYETKIEDKRAVGKIGSRRKKTAKVDCQLYGREAIVAEYLDFLIERKNKCLVIVGDSGTGKSSLVKGGLLPAMRAKGYSTKILQPGADLEDLAAKILNFLLDIDNPTARESGIKGCLYIDQFEECYTSRQSTPGDRERFDSFISLLNNALEGENVNFKLIASIRHDYAHEFDRKIGKWRQYKQLLRYPNQDEIFDIIVGPAFDRGISFSPLDLPEKISADAANTSYFLPLLSFSLQTLYKYDVENNPALSDSDTPLCLTADTYERLGGIVQCLQNEFTLTYNALSDQTGLFSQLIARMIVIKDTIPKARPLAISRINFREPGKSDRSIELLNQLVPRFLRTTTISIDGQKEECYEPLHDSLLIYCDEIRRIVNEVQKPDSQMYLQPVIESAVREWKAARSKNTKSSSKVISDIIAANYRELEPLYNLLEDSSGSLGSWLFTEELDLVAEGKKYADSLSNSEKLALANTIQQLELQRKEQALNEEKLRADREIILAGVEKQNQELRVEESKREVLTEKLRSQKQAKYIIALFSGIALIVTIGTFLIWLNLKDRATQKRNAAEQQKYIRQIKDDSAKLAQNKKYLLYELDTIMYQEDRLKYAEYNQQLLFTSLKSKQKSLLAEKNRTDSARRSLASALMNKDSAITEAYGSNARLSAKISSFDSLARVLDSQRKSTLITLARLNEKAAPALSYRLTEAAMAANPNDSEAMQIQSSLATHPQYFESLILDHVEQLVVSRNGRNIATVQKDPSNLNFKYLRIADAYGRHLYSQSVRSKAINTIDLSYDNRLLMFIVDDTLRIIDIASRHEISTKPLSNIRFARFAENDNRIFWASNNEIALLDPGSMRIDTIPMNIRGNITNGMLQKNLLVITTSMEVDHFDLNTAKKSSIPLVQSFLLKDNGLTLGIGNRLFSPYPWLTVLDSAGREIWAKKMPGNKYHLTVLSGLISHFVSSIDGKYGLIRFGANISSLPTAVSQYFIEIRKGTIIPFSNTYVNDGTYLLSAKCDTAFEYSGSSISAYRLIRTDSSCSAYPTPVSIGENSRFKLATLAGSQKDLILTIDGNDELKLWRFGDARELEKRQQLWVLSGTELKKILSNYTP